MAILDQATGTTTTATIIGLTLSGTGAGSRAVFISVNYDNSGATLNGVGFYNSAQDTLLAQMSSVAVATNGNKRSALLSYALSAGSSSNMRLVVSFTAAPSKGAGAAAILFDNIDPTTPNDTGIVAVGNSTNAIGTATSEVGDRVFGGAANHRRNFTNGAQQTAIQDTSAGDASIIAAYESGSATVVMNFSLQAADVWTLAIANINELAAPTNRTITAEAGAYLYTGQTVQFDIIQTSDAAAYTESGQVADFDIAMTALSGLFTLDGQVVNLVDNNPQVVTAEAGAFSEAGQTVQFDVVMPAEAGTYTEAGQDVTLTATGSSDTPIVAEAGAFTLAGQAVQFAIFMASVNGAIVYTGQAAGLIIGLTGDSGSIAEGTQSGTLNISMAAEAGSISWSGQDVTLSQSSAQALTAEAASYVVTTSEATLSFTSDTEEQRPGAGSGKMRYFEAGEEFWEVRRRHLERLKPKMDSPPRTENHDDTMAIAERAAIDAMHFQRKKAYLRAQTSLSYERLKDEERRIIELSGSIAKLRQQWDDVLIVLLLDS